MQYCPGIQIWSTLWKYHLMIIPKKCIINPGSDFSGFISKIFFFDFSYPSQLLSSFSKSFGQILLFLLLLFTLTVHCQELSNLKSQKPFNFNGNLNFGGSYYHNSSPSAFRATPSSYFIQGNISLSFYGFEVPLSITYRDAQSSFTGPFRRIGISPSYKWVKIHAGYSSVNFSPYILSGMPLLGGGVELNPKKLRLGFIAGTAQSPKFITDATQENISWIQPNKRIIQSYRLGYGTSNNYIDILMLRGTETEKYTNAPDSLFSSPSSNLVLGLQNQLSLIKNRLVFKINVATSAISRNDFASIDSAEITKKWYTLANKLLPVNQSSRVVLAGDVSLNFTLNALSFGIKYDRIDPQYASFGTYYFRDDYENYTINTGFGLFKDHLFINGSFGLSRNNLLQQRSATSIQKIYQVNANAQITRNLGFSALLTNFNFNQEASLTQIDDSLKFVQVSKNYMIAPYWNVSNKKNSHAVQLTYNAQTVEDIQLETTNNLSAISLSYSFRNKATGISTNLIGFRNGNNFQSQQAKQNGMSLSLSKSFVKNKYSLRTRINFSKNTVDALDDGSTFGAQLSGNARIIRNYSLSMQMGLIKKNSIFQRSYQEFRAGTTIYIPLNRQS